MYVGGVILFDCGGPFQGALYASEAKLPLQERKRSEQQNIRCPAGSMGRGLFMEGVLVFIRRSRCVGLREGKRGYLSRL